MHTSLKNKCTNCPDLRRSEAVVIYSECFKPGCPKQISFELRIVKLVNAVRKKAGLWPLEIDANLTKAAREKSKDMSDNNYFCHVSPTHGTPQEMIKSFGFSCRWSGENIASGFPNPEMTFKEWMKSPGHRFNILKPEYTHTGVGYFYSRQGTFKHYWTQEFGELV
ncbi:MAG TPA: CAP domain-containing protein [Desulfobacteria bacterium]|nr:CAP domain-containing protein [Desulfobacteria bacterium]